jgi:predicted amidophosphoribosyltransferase
MSDSQNRIWCSPTLRSAQLATTAGKWLKVALGALLTDARCASCDAEVPHNTLFCRGCVSTVARLADGDAPFLYGGALSVAITRWKYGGRWELGCRFGELLGTWAQARLHTVARDRSADVFIVPVALSSAKLRKRGFNQALELASAIAEATGCKVHATGLGREAAEQAQAELGREQRLQATTGRFSASEKLRGKQCIIVDDVKTTGATLAAARAAIEAVGGIVIASWTLAVTPRHDAAL